MKTALHRRLRITDYVSTKYTEQNMELVGFISQLKDWQRAKKHV